MKKIITAHLMLCLVTVVVPPIPNGDNNDDSGISTHEYCCTESEN